MSANGALMFVKGGEMKLVRYLAPAVAMALALGACNPGDDEGGKFRVKMDGAAEVCEGDTCGGNGSGTAIIEINSDQNEVCYQIRLSEVQDVTAAHIHAGSEGVQGPVVVDLAYQGSDEEADACVDGIKESVLEEVSQRPGQHYLNVHSKRYQDGAARGQLTG
jgi:hypothetical protein